MCLTHHASSPALDKLIVLARGIVMTPQERRAQAISFVYGNTHIENPHITREMVAKAYDRLAKEGRIRSGD